MIITKRKLPQLTLVHKCTACNVNTRLMGCHKTQLLSPSETNLFVVSKVKMAELREMEHPPGKGRQVVVTEVHEPQRPHHHGNSLPPARQGRPRLRRLSPLPSPTAPQQVMRGDKDLQLAPMVPHLDRRQDGYLVVRDIERLQALELKE